MHDGGYLAGTNKGVRTVVLLGTLLLHFLFAVIMMITWNVAYSGDEQNTLSVVDVARQNTEPDPEPAAAAVSETPPAEEARVQPEPARPRVELLPPPLPRETPVPIVQSPPELEAAPADPAQESAPSPPQTSEGGMSWEDRILAALNAEKRYPSSAQRRRQQGVPWIRFVIDRSGNVLSSDLERSSGFDALDREAVRLPRRAEPLPPPPSTVSGESIELIVPVEFFMR